MNANQRGIIQSLLNCWSWCRKLGCTISAYILGLYAILSHFTEWFDMIGIRRSWCWYRSCKWDV